MSIVFGRFVLDRGGRSLRYGTAQVPIAAREFDLLALLASRAESAVSKDEILRAVWRNEDGTDAALTQSIYRLRKLLAAYDGERPYVKAIPGEGYQFVQEAIVQDSPPLPDVSTPGFRYYRRAMSYRASTTAASLAAAIELFELSLKEEPASGHALTAAAEAYLAAGALLFLNPSSAFAKARSFIERALEDDAGARDAHAVLSGVRLFSDADAAGAADAARHALARAPHSPRAHVALAWSALAERQFDAALAHAAEAVYLGPASPDCTAALGIMHYYARRFDAAWVHFEDALEIDRENAFAQQYALRTLCAMRRYDEATAMLEEMTQTGPPPLLAAFRGYLAGKRHEMFRYRRFSAEIAMLAGHRTLRALAAIGSGRIFEAAEHLHAAVRTREPGLLLVAIDPLFEPVAESVRPSDHGFPIQPQSKDALA